MVNHDTEIVSAVKLSIAERIGDERFELWLRGAGIEVRDQRVRITTGTELTTNWLRANLRSQIEAACQATLGADIALEFSVDESLGKPPRSDASQGDASNALGNGASRPDAGAGPHSQQDPQTTSAARVGGNHLQHLAGSLTSKRTDGARSRSGRQRFAQLETFVPGNVNRVANSSAELIVANPGLVSPLFLYGGPGTGKTHLCQGIWSSLRRRQDAVRTVYLSAEQFTTYFLQALNGSGLPSFRRRYRQVDLLVIEDIQFFAGKRATIVELQHTIDAVLREGRQLVLTADAPPNELMTLGNEMFTRMTGGLVVRMEPPDRQARRDILKQEARIRGMEVPDDVVELIADRLIGDVRRLQGALNRLRAHSLAWDSEITTDMAGQALQDIFRCSAPVLRLSDIESAVCGVFEITPNQMRSANKSRRVSHPRMLAMWLARKYTRAGLVEIGEYFGRRSHATVISASKKVTNWVDDRSTIRLSDQDCAVDEAIRQVESKLLG